MKPSPPRASELIPSVPRPSVAILSGTYGSIKKSMNRIFVLLVSMCFCVTGYAQTKLISGKVHSTSDNIALPYVNIGISKKGVGTVSDFEGNFRLFLKDIVSENDSVVFSHIGFITQKIVVADLINSKVIVKMEPSLYDLDEVELSVKAPKEKKIGRHSKGLELMHTNFYTAYEEDVDDRLSKEKGMRLKIKGNCLIQSLNFNITSNDFSSLKFRVNFYDLNDGKPDNLIVQKNIIFEIKNQYMGWYKVDLKPYAIYLEKELGNIAVTIQWLESVKSNEKSKFFSISTASSATEKAFHREKAMDDWTINGQSFSFYLDALCN